MQAYVCGYWIHMETSRHSYGPHILFAMHSSPNNSWDGTPFSCASLLSLSFPSRILTIHQSDHEKKGSTWATRLIFICWNLVHHLWTHHNSVLHESQALASLSGLEDLQNLITAKYALVRSSLHQVYNRYFTTTLETILLQSPDQLKLWFLVIRSGREADTSEPLTPSLKMLHCANGLVFLPFTCNIPSLYLYLTSI